MKVFAFLCAIAVAVSVPNTEAATITEKACTENVCAVTPAAAIKPAETIQISPPTCPDSGKAYVVAIKYDGATGDKISLATKDATGTALTNADATDCSTADADKQDIKAKTCGKTDAKGVRVDLTCNNAVGSDCTASYSVTFECAAAVVDDTSVDVSVTCDKPACTKDSLSIPDGKKAIYAAPTCATSGEKAYLAQIAITGATGDLYTFVTKSADTALTDKCVLATSSKDVAVGTTDAPLTCGKGLGTAITVEVTCARGDKTACAPTANTVTFACAAAETPAPSTGSMLTKANAIVGVISGMVGAIVYFNRG